MFLRRFVSSYSPSAFKFPPTIQQLLTAPLSVTPPVITVSGWIKSIRRQKNVTFAVLTDGSSAHGLQAVFIGNGDRLKGLTNGAAVRLTGKLVTSPGPGQDKELFVDLGKADESSRNDTAGEAMQILGPCDPETYPIQKQSLSTEYLRDHSHLRPRTDVVASMIRLRSQLKRNIESFLEDQGFCYAHTPVLTGNDAEGAGDAFRLAETRVQHPAATPSSKKLSDEFFGRPAYLTVSHQLHLEALTSSLSRVYTLSPCFRAEPSLTGRHLAEFLMLEAEWAFGDIDHTGLIRLEQVCALVEGCLRKVVATSISDREMDVLWKGGEETKRRALTDAITAREPWTRITYTEAIKALEAHFASSSLSRPFHYKPEWGRTLQSEHERWLAEALVCGPVFITDYPRALKPFYMRVNAAADTDVGRSETVACVDLIIPHVGELVGGSVREDRLDILEMNLGHNAEAYRWYLELRQFGGAPHAGFGMGFERLVGWVSGIDNVRECIPFPRWAGKMLL